MLVCGAAVRWAWKNEEAASLVEYLLLVFLIAMVCLSGASFLGRRARIDFDRVANVLRRAR
jgi:Flp pilus assembly pilin Flp